MNERDLQEILKESSARHRHLCPRQVLGARIGMAGTALLGMDAPRKDKRLLVFLETDGCFADGVEAATGCTVGHRTLRVVDYGKVAATFVDVKTETAVRVAPQLEVRQRAPSYAPEENKRYFAQLVGYQRMPANELLAIQSVKLTAPVASIVSRPGVRKNCAICGEEIINEREVWRNNMPLCQACCGPVYYAPTRYSSFNGRFSELALTKI